MNCQDLRAGVDSRRHTADLDRQLAIGLSASSPTTVYCDADKDADVVNEDVEMPAACDDGWDQPFNSYAGTVWRLV